MSIKSGVGPFGNQCFWGSDTIHGTFKIPQFQKNLKTPMIPFLRSLSALALKNESHSIRISEILLFKHAMTKNFGFFCIFSENLHLQVAPSLEIDREAPKKGFFTSLGCWLISENDQRSRRLPEVEKTDFFCSSVNFLIKLLKMSKKNTLFFGPNLRNLIHRKVAFQQ